MSFLFGGRPQPSSQEKIAMAEAELELIQDMYSKYVRAQRNAKGNNLKTSLLTPAVEQARANMHPQMHTQGVP